MTPIMAKFLEAAGEPLGSGDLKLDKKLTGHAGDLHDELVQMLSAVDGFYAIESALHVFPAKGKGGVLGLDTWNAPGTWISAYEGAADGALYFAEDAFGFQFAIKDGAVAHFDPETARFDRIADTLSGWAQAIMDEPDEMTGWSVASAWQQANHPLTPGKRLYPKIPFVLDADLELDGFFEGDPVERMHFCADIHRKFKDVPSGSTVKLFITD